MNFLDFLIRIREREDEEKKSIQGYITNKLACFLMISSKGQRFYTGSKERYFKEEIKFVHFFKYEHGEIEDKIVDLLFGFYSRYELKKAFENPELSYQERMLKAKENYKSGVELKKLFSS